MELEIQTWGEGAAVRLPVEFLNQMNLRPGDKMTIEIIANGAILKRKVKYSLDELVRQCDMSAADPKDLAQWGNLIPVGREQN